MLYPTALLADALADHNINPKPFVWTADPDRIIAAAKRGYQTLHSIH
jgi:hypothetical protein